MSKSRRDRQDAARENDSRLKALDVNRDSDLAELMERLKAAKAAVDSCNVSNGWGEYNILKTQHDEAFAAYNRRANAYKSMGGNS